MPQDSVKFDTTPSTSTPNNLFVTSTLLPALVILAVLVLGTGTGWYLSQNKLPLLGSNSNMVAPGAQVSSGGKEAGVKDTKNFKDTAQGVLKKGGIEGEGTHHLERDGGPSQSVYLTSSVVDLDEFVDQKVEIWGETFASKKAPWLMDVGKIKVTE